VGECGFCQVGRETESTVAWKALNPHCCCGVGRRKQEKPTESHVPF